MKSLKTEQFNVALAESQEEYNTLFVNINLKDRLIPVTCCFELSAEELAEINKTGKIYYQQCLIAQCNSEGSYIAAENGNYLASSLFHPMSIHVTNPLDVPFNSTIGGTNHHIDTKIESLLGLEELDLIEMFPKFQGNIRQHLQDRLDCGEVYVGSEGCDGFDPIKGCPGHDIEIN